MTPSTDQGGSSFASCLDIFVPDGGAVLLVEAVSYFDESYSDKFPQIVCVAGYIFEKKNGKKFDRDWRKNLAQDGFPFFHMGDCAHGNGIYKKLRKDVTKRAEIAKTHIELIKKYASLGLVATVYRHEWLLHISEIKEIHRPLHHTCAFGVDGCGCVVA